MFQLAENTVPVRSQHSIVFSVPVLDRCVSLLGHAAVYFYGCWCSAAVCKTLWSAHFLREEICITEAALVSQASYILKHMHWTWMSNQLSYATQLSVNGIFRLGKWHKLDWLPPWIASTVFACEAQAMQALLKLLLWKCELHLYLLFADAYGVKQSVSVHFACWNSLPPMFWTVPFNPMWGSVL